MHGKEFLNRLILLKETQLSLENQLLNISRKENMTNYNSELYSKIYNEGQKKVQALIQEQDELAMQSFHLIFNDPHKKDKLQIQWVVDYSKVLVEVCIVTSGEYKDLFDLAYSRLETWTNIDASQELAFDFSVKEYQFNSGVSFYGFINDVLPKLNVKDLKKWQDLCSKLYGLKNKRLFNAVLADSFDKSNQENLQKVCDYLFSKKGFSYILKDFTDYAIGCGLINTFSNWSLNYKGIPGYSEMPFIQQKMLEMHFKPLFFKEHLSLLLRVENALHEATLDIE